MCFCYPAVGEKVLTNNELVVLVSMEHMMSWRSVGGRWVQSCEECKSWHAIDFSHLDSIRGSTDATGLNPVRECASTKQVKHSDSDPVQILFTRNVSCFG